MSDRPHGTNPWRENALFWQRTCRLLGEAEAARLFCAEENIARGLTVNTARLSAADFAAHAPFAVAPGGFAAASFRLLDPQARPGTHPWYHAGAYYVQEPSASSAAQALGVQPGDRVLDLCAAPGGKSAQLAAALQGQGVLVSNEYDPARSRILLSNSERMGAPNVVVVNDTAQRVADTFAGYFNKVLVDAPCSGEGMFRKEPQAVAQYSAALVEHCAALQAEILEQAARCVAPGGELVYSTCTFSPQEDEGQIGAFLARHPEFALQPTGLTGGCPGHESHCVNGPVDVSLVRRIYPCHGGEGHFVAKLRREGEGEPLPTLRPQTGAEPLPAGLKTFLQQYFPHAACMADGVQAQQWKENLLLLPRQPLPSLARLHLVRCGVLAGSMEGTAPAGGRRQSPRGGRFVPAHHLLHVFGGECANREELTAEEPRTAAYLRGEEIAAVTAEDGWCAVCVDGMALGLGKVSGGRVKNHYPKGLRNLK